MPEAEKILNKYLWKAGWFHESLDLILSWLFWSVLERESMTKSSIKVNKLVMWGYIQVLWKILCVFTWFFWLLITFLGPFSPVLTRHVFHLEQSSRHQQRHLWHKPKFSEQAVLHYCEAQLGCLTKLMWSREESLSWTWKMPVLAQWHQLNWHS